jgi:hypothetical protein
MFIAALAAVIVSPMLFPDETDYRVLTPLPLTRAQLFGARLAAVGIVSAAAIVAINVVASLAFPAFSGGRWADHGLGPRVLAHASAACLGSAWMVSGVMALQGACLVVLPHAWRHRAAATLQASVFLLLLVSMPLLVRLTGRTVNDATVAAAPQSFLPPVWFLGLERWLLDGPASGGYARAAAMAATAWVATIAAVAAAFLVLFRSAESLAGAATGRRPSPLRLRAGAWLRRRALLPGPQAAVIGFAIRGLFRSRLHQFVFVVVLGCGLALLAGQVATVAEGRTLVAARPQESINNAIAGPLLVTLCVTIGLRAVFLLPLDRGAGWVFRLVDDPAMRPAALCGVASVFNVGAVAPALAVAAALQPPLLGVLTIPSAILTTLAGLALVEFVLRSWRRIPYACSYLPGKHHLTYTIAVLLAAYGGFVTIGANVLRWSVVHPSHTLFTGGLLLALVAGMRRARLRDWGTLPLEFVDEDPAATIVLSLGPG